MPLIPNTDRSGSIADPRLVTLSHRLVPTVALLTAGTAAVALAGWVFDLDALRRVVPSASSMKPLTAVCLLLLGLTLWLTSAPTPARRWGAAGGCVVVIGIAVTVLLEYAAGLSLPLDRVLFATAIAADTVGSPHPGRPAPNTAATLVLLGLAQLLLLAGRGRRAVLAAQVLSLAAAVVGLLGLYGFAFRVSESEGFLGLTGMALHTAVAVLLAAGATFFVRPEQALARLLVARGPSAMLTRRMLIATVTVPPLLGAACLYGEGRQSFDSRLGVALLVAGNVIVFAVVSFVAGTRAARLEAAEAQTAATAAELRVELVRREQTETELRIREAELTSFAYEVAHDLRGPLTPIGGFANILAEDLSAGVRDGSLLSPNVEQIRKGVDRMEHLIADLLAYATARDGAFHPAPVDLQAMVAEVIAERTGFIGAAGSVLFPDICTGPLPTVHADPALCRQLLDNLIGNAIKYTSPGNPAQIAINAEVQPDGWVRVDVADRGIGISASDQDQVFASFHRATTDHTYAGTGLGLAICRRVVDRHRGSIRVDDNPGGGTRFSFTLPGQPATAADGP